MQLNEYQNRIAKFAVYPDVDTGSKAELSYLALGLGGESGEVLEKTKKFLRDGVFDRVAVAKELGDVLWYLARYTNAIGWDLNNIADLNVRKLEDRLQRDVLTGSGDDR